MAAYGSLNLLALPPGNGSQGRVNLKNFVLTCLDKQTDKRTDFYHSVWTFLSKQTEKRTDIRTFSSKQTDKRTEVGTPQILI